MYQFESLMSVQLSSIDSSNIPLTHRWMCCGCNGLPIRFQPTTQFISLMSWVMPRTALTRTVCRKSSLRCTGRTSLRKTLLPTMARWRRFRLASRVRLFLYSLLPLGAPTYLSLNLTTTLHADKGRSRVRSSISVVCC